MKDTQKTQEQLIEELRELREKVTEFEAQNVERIGALEKIQEQARLFDLVFEHSPDSIVILDADFNFIRVSKTYARGAQRPSEEFPGNNHFEFNPSDFEPEALDTKKRKVPHLKCDRPVVHPDHPEWGTTYWDIGLMPVLDSEGEVVFFIFTSKDVTERVRAEAALRESEVRYRELVEGTKDLVAQVNADGVLTYVNHMAGEILGLPAEECLGLSISSFVHAEDLVRTEAWFEDCVRAHRPSCVIEIRQVSQASKVHDMIWSCTFQYDEAGMLVRLSGIGRDITERKRMSNELQHAHNLRSLGVLAGGIAHDFNNVLAGVIGGFSLLVKAAVPESSESEIAKNGVLAGRRAKSLAQQLLTFAKGGAPVKELTSIGAIIEETTQISLHGSNSKPVFQLAEDLHFAQVDQGQIGQVVQNLVINADQAMPEGGTIMVSAENVKLQAGGLLPSEAGEFIKVSVGDQGAGMPEGVKSRIFVPYYTTKPAGHGLGLSISRSIIKRHGGFLTVHSEVGVGTRFEFYLPAQLECAPAHVLPSNPLEVGGDTTS